MDSGGAGTGTLIGKAYDPQSGNLYLGFVTADHVVRGTSGLTLGFRGLNDPNSFNIVPDSSATFLGGPGNVVDMAFIGATVNLNNLTPLQGALLNSLNPLTVGVAPAAPGFNFTENGYGRSGRPDANFPGFAYVYHHDVADEQYGTQRFFNNTVQNYLNYNNGFYNFDAMNWFLRDAAGGAIAGEGQGNSGDSGASILYNGQIVGLLDDVWGDNTRGIWKNDFGDEGFKIGSEGLGPRMTQAYHDWLVNLDNAYCEVPEPGSAILIFLGGLVFIGVRRRAQMSLVLDSKGQ
jgi:hypothetical protein